ncbi:ABC transporter ATP-binding protein [Paenibacillus sp. GSMTC-2017]|uniref:ABC transporter ATP-binding protein n=1 Tax=Paenibacillus sp. GSMTC-2017 TaxID=2794350 RepID=UPI0018D64C5A|nr:ABC transporter ATP-binding protein [Paenibacillus sp. GSMTC-2017]MBH5319651.1 ABC transporter ATP-binding protein [Paenibacillus sp. GSMTC-2017]
MKPIFYFLKRIHRYAGNVLILNFIGMLLVGLLQSVGILLIIPLLSIVGLVEMDASGIAYLSSFMVWFDGIPITRSLAVILAIYVCIIIGQSWFNRHQTILNKKIQQGFLRQLREDTYRNVLKANWEFFLRTRKSDIVKMMTTEIGHVKKGMNLSLQFVSALILAAVKIVLAFVLAPKITTAVLLIGGLLLLCSRYFLKKSKQFGQDNIALSKVYMAGITDHLNGIKDIKSNTLEASHMDWMSSLCEQVESNSVAFTKLKSNSQFLYSVVSAIMLAAFIFVLVSMFHSQPAQLLLIVLIFSRLWPVITRIQTNLEMLATMVPSFEALIKLQDDCLQSQEHKDDSFQVVEGIKLKQGLECEGVYFSYHQKKDHYALKNINLHIPVNDMTAIVGSSGAGKSTLVDLLMGLNKPDQGKVLIDGQPLTNKNVLPLRRSISYVSQDPFLFNATIRENLLLMDAKATEEQMWSALEMASASNLVKDQKDGLDTFIGDRGIRLSGGERQRLVLARAILRKPSILILDEATSALDTDTESQVTEALEGLKGKMTIIVIAHRLSTIRHADQVIVLEKGEIAERGGFQELSHHKKNSFGLLLGGQLEVSS